MSGMAEKPQKTLALFDFDGTITTRDTLFELIKFLRGKRSLYLGMAVLSPYLFLYLIKLLPNWKVKERVFTYFLGGMPADAFERRCEKFAEDKLPPLIRREAVRRIQQLKQNEARIIVVTASAENWVAPWCRRMNIECIGTRLETKNGRLTGKISGHNCNGEEKVRRVKAEVDLSGYSEILAYGDTKNDLPMLRLATRQYYRAFS